MPPLGSGSSSTYPNAIGTGSPPVPQDPTTGPPPAKSPGPEFPPLSREPLTKKIMRSIRDGTWRKSPGSSVSVSGSGSSSPIPSDPIPKHKGPSKPSGTQNQEEDLAKSAAAPTITIIDASSASAIPILLDPTSDLPRPKSPRSVDRNQDLSKDPATSAARTTDLPIPPSPMPTDAGPSSRKASGPASSFSAFPLLPAGPLPRLGDSSVAGRRWPWMSPEMESTWCPKDLTDITDPSDEVSSRSWERWWQQRQRQQLQRQQQSQATMGPTFLCEPGATAMVGCPRFYWPPVVALFHGSSRWLPPLCGCHRRWCWGSSQGRGCQCQPSFYGSGCQWWAPARPWHPPR